MSEQKPNPDEERAADQRAAAAIERFYRAVLGGAPLSDCRKTAGPTGHVRHKPCSANSRGHGRPRKLPPEGAS
jgi:hypothetical protein